MLAGASALRDWTSRHPCPIRSAALRTVILLLATSGLRISGALHLTLQDVDLAEGVLPVRQPKFRKSRLVPVSAGTLETLRTYHDLRIAVAPGSTTCERLSPSPGCCCGIATARTSWPGCRC